MIFSGKSFYGHQHESIFTGYVVCVGVCVSVCLRENPRVLEIPHPPQPSAFDQRVQHQSKMWLGSALLSCTSVWDGDQKQPQLVLYGVSSLLTQRPCRLGRCRFCTSPRCGRGIFNQFWSVLKAQRAALGIVGSQHCSRMNYTLLYFPRF